MRGHKKEPETVNTIDEGVNNPAIPGDRERGVREETQLYERNENKIPNMPKVKVNSASKSTQLCNSKACVCVHLPATLRHVKERV